MKHDTEYSSDGCVLLSYSLFYYHINGILEFKDSK